MKHSTFWRLCTTAVWALATLSAAGPAAAQAPVGADHPFAASSPIPGHYLVVFKDGVGNPAAEANNALRGHSAQLGHVYSHAIKGFSARLSDAAVQALRNNPLVASVEPDLTVALQQTSPQANATWGLDRIDQADRPLDTQYFFNTTGSGVHAFIIDTGIRADHTEFTGRVLPGYTAIADGNGTNDCNGHGTHVSGTVGGSTWGVAKGVKLIAVRVLDCSGSGSLSGVVAGVDWVAGSSLRPAVANMSLGSSKSSTVNAAVAGAVTKGVSVVVAAGNSSADACRYSPSSEPSAITVGATTNSDARASYSNFGSCVDVFAPGSSITSAWHTSASATNTISGTSMASPHVAGVAALALGLSPDASPVSVANFITSNATAGRLSSIGTGSPNLLVYSLAAGTPQPVVPSTVAVKSLTGSASKAGKNWRANVVVTIRNISSGAHVANATVSGSFAPGGTASCTTGSTGSCTLSSGSISSTTASTTLTVNTVTGSNMVYDSAQNAASSLTVSKP